MSTIEHGQAVKANITDKTSKAAKQFVEKIYDFLDNQRQNLQYVYRDNSQILWNGNAYTGADDLEVFWGKDLPTTKHEVTTIDCQPILITGQTETSAAGSTNYDLLVTCSGSVTYQGNEEKDFNQTFVLVQTVDKEGNLVHYVAHDTFRFCNS